MSFIFINVDTVFHPSLQPAGLPFFRSCQITTDQTSPSTQLRTRFPLPAAGHCFHATLLSSPGTIESSGRVVCRPKFAGENKNAADLGNRVNSTRWKNFQRNEKYLSSRYRSEVGILGEGANRKSKALSAG